MSGHPIPTGAPVQPLHLTLMAHRLADSAQDIVLRTIYPGPDSPEYKRAVRSRNRRREALWRLAEALHRQPGWTR